MNSQNLIEMNVMLPDILGAKGIIGVPPEIAQDALRKTAIDFCVMSTIWEYESMFLSQFNVADYPIDVPEDARLASMRWMSMNGTLLGSDLPHVPLTGFQRLQPNSYYGSRGYTFSMEGRDFVWVNPVPQDNTSVIRFCAALKPTQSSCRIPEFLYQDWLDTLTAGTAYRLFQIPKQDWTNNALAMLNEKEYRKGIARARLTKMQNYSQKTAVMSGSYF